MSCGTCGRDDGHYIGCEKARVVTTEPQRITSGGIDPMFRCEHDGCSKPKKKWSGKGAKPKYCAAGHKKEK
jgi:hypothetical protein